MAKASGTYRFAALHWNRHRKKRKRKLRISVVIELGLISGSFHCDEPSQEPRKSLVRTQGEFWHHQNRNLLIDHILPSISRIPTLFFIASELVITLNSG
jgi:hypothetical protein